MAQAKLVLEGKQTVKQAAAVARIAYRSMARAVQSLKVASAPTIQPIAATDTSTLQSAPLNTEGAVPLTPEQMADKFFADPAIWETPGCHSLE